MLYPKRIQSKYVKELTGLNLNPPENGGKRNDDDVEIDRGEKRSKSGVRESNPLVLRLLRHPSLKINKIRLGEVSVGQTWLSKNKIKSFALLLVAL